ncbi:MAG: amidohydrolase family protein [Pirellulales bacterium]
MVGRVEAQSGTDRREFLRMAVAAASATAGATCLVSGGRAAEATGPAIIDCHQHLWDLDRFRLPWLEEAQPVLRRSYGVEDYRAATQGINVRQAVYLEVDVDASQLDAEAEALVELSRGQTAPTRGVVIGGRPGAEEFAKYIERHRGAPEIKGVRQVLNGPATPPGHCTSRQFVDSIRRLAEFDWSFDLCIAASRLDEVIRLVEQAPDTRFILDHCGGADPKAWFPDQAPTAPSHEVDAWKRSLDALARHDRVDCKISGVVASLPEGWGSDRLAPIIDYCLEAFGPDRVVFGSDWPVCLLGRTYAQWVGLLTEVIGQRPADEQRRLWHDNALRVYRLQKV